MLSFDEIHGMLVNQLKDELKSRGASTLGKKAELVTRLEELIVQESDDKSYPESESRDVELKDDVVVDDESKSDASVEVAGNVDAVDAPASDPQATDIAEENGNVVSAQSPANEVQSIDKEKEKSENNGYTHVRIDNFQRPLNQKALIEWIESQCNCVLAPDSVWINTIKTHCYVDFSTEEEARRCVENVSGKKYPASSPYVLEADYTSVSAKEAPQSVEGSLKPGAWKVVPGSPLPASPKASNATQTQQKSGRTIAIDTAEPMDTHDDAPPSSNKRKLDDTATSPAAETSSNKRRVAGLDIFRRATAGILLGRPGGAPSNVYEAPSAASAATGFTSRKSREDDMEPGEEYSAENIATNATDAASLEDLFRKTTTSTPALYWLPAPDEVVQQRLKSRLLSRGQRR